MAKPYGDFTANNQDNPGKFYPSGLEWAIDIPDTTLIDMLDQTVRHFSDKPCMEFLGKTTTYKEFDRQVTKAAAGLQQQGLKKGDRVGLYMPNTSYYPVMFFAALKAGATVVNFSPLYTETELEKQIEDSGTKMMVTVNLKKFGDQNAAENTKNLVNKGALEKLVVCPFEDALPCLKSFALRLFKKDMLSSPDYSNPKIISFDDITGHKSSPEPVNTTPDDLAVLQYTGGTTGVPKGAMLSHFNLVSNVTQVREMFGRKFGQPEEGTYLDLGSEKVMGAIPFFHVFGMTVSMLTTIHMANQMVIVPNPRDIKDVMKTIHKKKPTIFPAVPLLMQKISEHPHHKKYDFTSLKAAVSGGAALPPNVKEAFEQAVGKDGMIKQGYGLTETSPVACSNPPLGSNRPETVGLPYPLTKVKIIDINDPSQEMPQGEDGEICIRGPQVMQGYWNKPEATAEVMTEDGYFRTGDIGHIDTDGYVRITDRLKRMISINGMKVYPNMVENAISLHPAIAECVVVGVNKQTNKEAAKAFIRFKDDVEKKPSEGELCEFLKEHINRIEIPRFFEFRDEELPKTSVGKPDWKTLEDQEAAKAQQSQKPNNQTKPQL